MSLAKLADGVAGVLGVLAKPDKILVLLEDAEGVALAGVVFDGVGVPRLTLGDGVYEALRALSVPSLIPNFDVANLCAAGLIVDTLTDKLALLGVLTFDLAFSMAFPFLSL